MDNKIHDSWIVKQPCVWPLQLEPAINQILLLRMYFIWALGEGLIQTYFTEISQPISNSREIYLVFKFYNISL